MKKYFILLFISFLFIENCIIAQSKDSLIKVSDGVYEITGFLGNISFLVTDDGVILIDVGNSPQAGKRTMEYIASITSKPLKYVIITHYHFDHVGGLGELPVTAQIIGQKNGIKNLKNGEDFRRYEFEKKLPHEIDSLKQLKDKFKTMGSRELVKIDSILKAKENKLTSLKNEKTIYPSILVDSLKTIVLGKDTIELYYPGKAHTDGDLVVYFKNRNIMALGDLLFNHSYPYMDPLGDAANWSLQLQRYAKFNAKIYIPGHFGLAHKDDLLLLSNYLTELRNEVIKLKKAGKPLNEIKSTVNLTQYKDFELSFLREMNIEEVYNQLK